MNRKKFAILLALLTVTIMLVVVQIASAGEASCDSRVNNTHAKLLECVTLDGVREHQAAFQAIADANNGIRTSGTPGYDAICRLCCWSNGSRRLQCNGPAV